MYDTLHKLEGIDTLGGYHHVGWGLDERVGQSGIKIIQYTQVT